MSRSIGLNFDVTWPNYLWLVLPGLSFFFVLINVATWTRGRAGSARTARISVCIPARNEANNIEACLNSVFETGAAFAEVLVYDDHSTDDTGAIARRFAAVHPELRVIEAEALPAGWVGKPHACHQLAKRATGEYLLFLDADVRLRAEALPRLMSLVSDFSASIVTMVPRQRMVGFAERLVLPLLHLTYTAWFPLFLVYRSSNPRFLAANGQLLFVANEAYRNIGGFESVRTAIVDDMAFCRRAKSLGHRVVFADGFDSAECRMYQSATEIWRGFSKNLYEGIGARFSALVVVLLVHLLAFIVPYVLWLSPSLEGVATLGIVANLSSRGLLAWRFRQPIEGILLHPIAVLGMLAIAVNSFAWSRRNAIEWRGRVYPSVASPPDGPP